MGMFVVAPSNHHLSDHPHVHSLNAPVSDPGATALGVGVIPLITSGENLMTTRGNRGGNPSNNNIQFWQHGDLRKPMFSDHRFLPDGGNGGASTSGSTTTCQDCGNQAKKDCTHRRCRTCCKSRGFDCATHVKSTWVPAARRRERLLVTSAGGEPGSSASTSVTKKARRTSQTTTSHTSTSNTSPSSSHHHQDASFMQSLPGQVRVPAVFKCVRVTAVEDGDDEYAYQASVTIGGHLFKGFLYDQGVEARENTNYPNLSELHLGGGRRRTSPPVDLPETYGSSGVGLIGGSSFGNPTS